MADRDFDRNLLFFRNVTLDLGNNKELIEIAERMVDKTVVVFGPFRVYAEDRAGRRREITVSVESIREAASRVEDPPTHQPLHFKVFGHHEERSGIVRRPRQSCAQLGNPRLQAVPRFGRGGAVLVSNLPPEFAP